MNIGTLAHMMHNGKLIRQAENILKDAVQNNINVYVENPDGTILKLQDGFKIWDYELILYKSE